MIYFITRSLYPFHAHGGGIARYLQVRDLVRAGYGVKVIIPLDEQTADLTIGHSVLGPSIEVIRPNNPVGIDVGRGLQALGVFDDYLSGWAHAARRLVKPRISASDTVLATSGGELGTLQLGAMLRSSVGCRLVYHLHDPPDHVDIDGLRVPSRYPHRNRKRAFGRLLSSADQVYTTNTLYANHLAKRYGIESKVSCRYIFDRDLLALDHRDHPSRAPNFVYGGNMSAVQRPELFHPAWLVAREIVPSRLTFVGKTQELAMRGVGIHGVECIPTMEREAFLDYSKNEIDVGLVSLVDPYHGYCTPSKLFDFLLCGTPVLVVGAAGDLVDLVTDNGLGAASKPGDVRTLAENMIRMSHSSERRKAHDNVIRYARTLAQTPLYSAGL